VINIGGGSSVLVDRLLDENYTDISVLDISATALDLARERLGSRSDQVNWIQGDVTEHRFDRVYQVWHDRAAFHFLIESAEQDDYVNQLRHAVAVGGHAIVATFSTDGPERCSGLLVQRYSESSLQERMGSEFEPVHFKRETHRTPSGVPQEFLYGHFLRVG
jgi:ubiquinone/menaquinone biosynthesis C-methylase UbiE